ncbi:MAG: hypothetical protein R2781_02900 [Flavobacteriaceae bacterium]
MNKRITYSFGVLEVHDCYLKAVINEGISIESDTATKIIEVSKKFFKKEKFGYITHRIHSYSVNPIVYKEVSEIPNLVGFAMVSENKETLKNSDFEKYFIKKPTKAFQKLEDAIDWIKNLVENS